MAKQERMFHQDLQVVLSKCDLHKAGENVAYGFDLGGAVVNVGWMKSPPHRRNKQRTFTKNLRKRFAGWESPWRQEFSAQ